MRAGKIKASTWLGFATSDFREDAQLLLWLLKDFMWSIYFLPLAVTFGTLTITVQTCILCYDVGIEVNRYTAIVEFCWLLGNYIWMYGDMLVDERPSTKYIVTNVPVFGEKPVIERYILTIAQTLFVSGFFICLFYLLKRQCRHPHDIYEPLDAEDRKQDFISRLYFHILTFWIMKEISWTISSQYNWFRIMAIVCAFWTFFFSVCLTIYCRKDSRQFFTQLTGCVWVLSNSLWMSSELYEMDSLHFLSIISFSTGVFMCVSYHTCNIMCCRFSGGKGNYSIE